MANIDGKKNIKDERIEDTTLYGEFIASFDQWITLDKQRERVDFLEKATSGSTSKTTPKNLK